MKQKLKMSMKTRKELLTTIKPRYLKSKKKDKSKILNEFIKNTGMDRKYVISLLSFKKDLTIKRLLGRKKRKNYYTAEDIFFLKKIWEVLDYACGQRMEGRIKEMIRKFNQFKEIEVPENIAKKLINISASTIDRRLKVYKKELRRRLLTTTKPGSLLKNQIPIRTISWDETRIGYCELDTVAHGGDNVKGEFIFSLTLTDILTQWTETEAVMGKGEKEIEQAMNKIKERLPFPLKGIDPDNGSEFINWNMIKYCNSNKINFTRGREYMKNDNAHVEQKNWTHVRQVLGYQRFDQLKHLNLMRKLYRNDLRLYKNFFIPNKKLIGKHRSGKHGEKIKKQFDKPKTPYERILNCSNISEEKKNELRILYDKLNPIALRADMLNSAEQIKKIKQIQLPNFNK